MGEHFNEIIPNEMRLTPQKCVMLPGPAESLLAAIVCAQL